MKTVLFLFIICTQAFAQVEPKAGTWKTWVIASGNAFSLPQPPGKKAAQAEIKELLVNQSAMSTEAIGQISYWNAGAPGYRWNQIANRLGSGNMPPFRALALLNVAIYDATVAAWYTKYHFNRSHPSQVSSQIKTLVSIPDIPSYPCEYAVTAGAAASVLAYLFPDKADSIISLARQAGQSRVWAGAAYPSDVEAGMELGRQVAAQVIARARQDGSDQVWKGSIPDKPGLWNGTNPVGAAWGSWKLWALDSASQFRPGPPPDFAKDMEELKNFKPTTQSKARAFYYATQNVWADAVHQKIFEYNLQGNAPRAARAYALNSIAMYDAMVSCWEAKYFYWGIRPYQYDTTYKQLLGPPPFPGYPSGHATTSNAAATVLSYLFPNDRKYLLNQARECAESRFEGGIHFRTDNEVGLEMGQQIGEAIIKRAKTDGADTEPNLVKK